MKLRLRFKIRTLLIAVAFAAVLLTVPIELWNRSRRDYYAKAEARFAAVAEEHERELIFCRSQPPGEPYVRGRHGKLFPGSMMAVKSWPEEAAWRTDQASNFRHTASKMAEMKRFYQRRMLLP